MSAPRRQGVKVCAPASELVTPLSGRMCGAGAIVRALLVLVAAALSAAGCASDQREAGERAAREAGRGDLAPPAEAAGLPEVSHQGVRVQVARIHRAGHDVVQIDLVLSNERPAAVSLDMFWPAAAGGLAEATLTLDDRTRRTKVLTDAGGTPQCSRDLGVLPSGATRALFLRFAALATDPHRVTLTLPGMPPLDALDVPPAPGSGDGSEGRR